MEGQANDLQEWEWIHQSGEPGLVSGNFEGVIRSDHFSLDNPKSINGGGDGSEGGSIDSDNPSWIDPGSDDIPCRRRKDTGELWSDSSSDRCDDRKLSDFDLGLAEIIKSHEGFGGIGELEAEGKRFVDFLSRESKFRDLDVMEESNLLEHSKGQVGMEEYEENEVLTEKLNSESVKNDLGCSEDPKSAESSEFLCDLDQVDSETIEVAKEKPDLRSGGEEEKILTWWKVPLEVLRYCVFRISPVWSFSVAAAIMGFIILGRRLYKMKHKSQSLQLKVTMDDKKVSQFMNRAARINEAFSVVRRVPVIRPSLPVAGVTPWPMMSLR